MSVVGSVTSQFTPENKKRNAVAGAAVGAVAAGSVGYLTKQIASVKDNATQINDDVFVRAVRQANEAIKEADKPFVEIDELKQAADKAKAVKEAAEAAVAKAAEEAKAAADKAAKEAAEAAAKAADALKEARVSLLKENKIEVKDGMDLGAAINDLRTKAKGGFSNLDNIILATSDFGKRFKELTKDGAEVSADKMKEFVKEYADLTGKNSEYAFKGFDPKTVNEEFLKEDGKVKDLFGRISSAVKNGEENSSGFKTKLNSLFESGKTKLKALEEGATEEVKNLHGALKKAIKSAKMKQAAIFGAIGAVVLGIAAFLISSRGKSAAEKTENTEAEKTEKA